MTAAKLIAALSAFPPETRVILSEWIGCDPSEGFETYADCEEAVIRHVDSQELSTMAWDWIPAVEPWAYSTPVILLKSCQFERDEYGAPELTRSGRIFKPIKEET